MKASMDTKSKILIALLDIASQEGLGNVSMSKLADKVGIRKSTLYSHYQSKDEIVQELYRYLRDQSQSKNSMQQTNYTEFVEGKSTYEILKQCVDGYLKMNSSEDLVRFYRFIQSERNLSQEAAEIMAMETEKMIGASKLLFQAMEDCGMAHFNNLELSALSFAMTIHGLMEYESDVNISGKEKNRPDLLESYIKEYATEIEASQSI